MSGAALSPLQPQPPQAAAEFVARLRERAKVRASAMRSMVSSYGILGHDPLRVIASWGCDLF